MVLTLTGQKLMNSAERRLLEISRSLDVFIHASVRRQKQTLQTPDVTGYHSAYCGLRPIYHYWPFTPGQPCGTESPFKRLTIFDARVPTLPQYHVIHRFEYHQGLVVSDF